MQTTSLKALVIALAIGTTQAAPTAAELITTPTHLERYRKILADASGEKLLPEPELSKATIWDFSQSTGNIIGSNGGHVSGIDPQSFPFIFDADFNVNYATAGPCGILLPHIHPRANEFFTTIDNEFTVGTRLEIGVFGPNNPEYVHKLPKDSGTLFPQGSIHWQINDSQNCKPSTAVVFLTSSDPGSTAVLQEPVDASMAKRLLGRADFEQVRAITPPHIVKLLDKCFERCNIA
ncbi:hypothetical protein DE146DRAFT_628888 [Phaeosphaeria sp. MPI-PUGE-AT-0046c]|nr:hypothetical protein DE146DRAFT_628888 [Phaeosphaeria sp. MPI-PUGE-AT-0046c]